MSDGLCLLHARREVTRLADMGESVLYTQGNVTNPYDGKTFMHAWAEVGNEVIDPTIDLKISKEKYYKTFSPKNVIRIEEPIMTLLCIKGDKFFTQEEVKKAYEKHFKYLQKKYENREPEPEYRKKKPKKKLIKRRKK